MKTYRDIQAQIDKLKVEAEKLRTAEKGGVIGRIKEAIAAYGLTASDLGLVAGAGRLEGARAKPAAKSSVGVARYRDPESGKTWTGMGKPPAWIAGKDRAAFAIGTAEKVVAPKGRAGKASKGKRAARPVGVPKYRNAATGQTWTGMGKPPGWIASAANREDFLIQGDK